MDDLAHQLKWNAIAYASIACAVLATLCGMWLYVPALRQRWLPLPRLRPGAWTGHEVFLAFCIFLGFQPIIVDVLTRLDFYLPLIGPAPDAKAPDAEKKLYVMRCFSLSSPLTLTVILGLVFTVMFARTGTRPHHFGLSWARWPANVALGILAFVFARPIIIGVFALALLVFSKGPDPFAALATVELPAWEWSLFAFQTTVAAPLLEEIVCRGLLQGWLRRASLTGHLLFLTMTLFIAVYRYADDLANVDVAAIAFSLTLAAGYLCGLYRLYRQFELSEDEVQPWQPQPDPLPIDPATFMTEDEAREFRRQRQERDEERRALWADANARLAIFGSAMLFAVIHSWPDSLALLPMGLILGWLYYRTQSLIGPITFHVLFNLATFVALYGSVLTKP